MSFTTLTIPGTVLLQNSSPANGAVVTMTLSSQITDGSSVVEPQAISARCNSDGQFSLSGINANDDPTTSPQGTYYKVQITYGVQVIDTFQVIVPHASAPSVDLFSLARLGTGPTAASPFVESIAGLNGAVAVVSPDSSVTITTEGGELQLEVGEFALEVGDPVSGASNSALLVTDEDGNLASGVLSSSVVTDSYLQSSPVLSSSYAAVVGATAGLVSFWKLGESTGTTAADSFGSNPGTYEGGFTLGETGALTDGSNATAVLLNGTSGYITVPNASDLEFTNALLFTAWVYVENLTNYQDIICKNSGTDYEWRIHLSTGIPQFSSTGITVGTASASTAVPLNTWTWLAVTYDGAHVRFYINGVLDVAVATTGELPTSTSALTIGARASGAFFLDGEIMMVSVGNQVLSGTSIASLYQARLEVQLAADAVAGTSSLRSLGTESQQALPGNSIIVTDEKLWVTDPTLATPADPTGTNYSDAAFAECFAKCPMNLYGGTSKTYAISGPAGTYKFQNQLGIPNSVNLLDFGGGARGAATFQFLTEPGSGTALGVTTGVVAAGATTVPLTNVKGTFLSSGVASIAGNIINYTGVTGSGSSVTLTGVTGMTQQAGTGTLCVGNCRVLVAYYSSGTALDKTISIRGPATSFTNGPVAPLGVGDGLYVSSSARVDCQVAYFRHQYVFAGNHEVFGPHCGGYGYSIYCAEAPLGLAWPSIDGGNQTWETNVNTGSAADWAHVYITANGSLEYATFNGQSGWHDTPFFMFGEATAGISNYQDICSIVDIFEPEFENLSLGIIGAADNTRGMAYVKIYNPSMSFGAPPAGFSPSSYGLFGGRSILNLTLHDFSARPLYGGPFFRSDQVTDCMIETTHAIQPNPFSGCSAPVVSPSGLTPPDVNVKFTGGRLVGGTANNILSGDVVQAVGVLSSDGLQVEQYNSLTAPVIGVAIEAETNYVVPIATNLDALAVNVNVYTSGDITAGTVVAPYGTSHAGKAMTAPAGGTVPAFGWATGADSGGQAPVLLLPTPYTAGLAGLTQTQTLTNKRVTARVVSITQAAAPVIDTDNMDIGVITGLTQAITSMTTNLTGTPNDGDIVEYRITDNGTARAIAWGAKFISTTVSLPTTTVISTTIRIQTQWNAAVSLWECVGVA